MLCTIYFHSRQVLLFDSFAEEQPWTQDIKVSRPCKLISHTNLAYDIMQLVCRLSNIAAWKIGTDQCDLGDWVAQPVFISFEQ